jgi:MFS family permease
VRQYLLHIRRFSPAARLFLGAHLLCHIGLATVWVLRNLYLDAKGYDHPFIGRTLSSTALGMVVVILALSRLMDRMRSKAFQVAGALCLAGGLVGVAVAGTKAAVLGASFFSGLGMALLEVSMAPFLARHSEAGERPYLFGVATALSPSAGLLATLAMKAGAAAWGENVASYGNMLLVGAGATAASIFLLAFIREEPVPPEAPEEGRFDWPTAARFCLPELVFGLGAGLTIPFINLYFETRFGLQVGRISGYYAGAQGLMMAAFLSAPVVARRFGAVPTIVAFQLTSIPFFLVLALSTSLPLAVGAFLLRHACMNMVHPVSSNFAMAVVHPRHRARLNGMKYTTNKVAWVIATGLGGYLIERTRFIVDGFATTMFVTMGLYVIGSALYWRFFRRESAGRVLAPEAEPTAGA